MRIIAGKHKGAILTPPSDKKVRPTSDKVRGAIFNVLHHASWRTTPNFNLLDAHIIDGFCGTGGLGLEGLSQGAASCLFIDIDPSLAKKNAEKIKAQNTHFLRSSFEKLRSAPHTTSPANLVFLDPPYNQDLGIKALLALQNNGFLAESAVIVLEEHKSQINHLRLPQDFKVLSSKIYGDTAVMFIGYTQGQST